MLSAELDQKCRTAISPGSTGWGVGSIQRDRVQPKAQATRSFPSYCRLLPPPSPPNTPPSPSMQIKASFHRSRAPLPPPVALVLPRLAWSGDPSELRLVSSLAGEERGIAPLGLCVL